MRNGPNRQYDLSMNCEKKKLLKVYSFWKYRKKENGLSISIHWNEN